MVAVAITISLDFRMVLVGGRGVVSEFGCGLQRSLWWLVDYLGYIYISLWLGDIQRHKTVLYRRRENHRVSLNVKGVENGSFLIPKRSDEASSTLPLQEEEPQNSSYAAAGGWGGNRGSGSEGNRTKAAGLLAQETSAGGGGGRELMMWKVFRRLKS